MRNSARVFNLMMTWAAVGFAWPRHFSFVNWSRQTWLEEVQQSAWPYSKPVCWHSLISNVANAFNQLTFNAQCEKRYQTHWVTTNFNCDSSITIILTLFQLGNAEPLLNETKKNLNTQSSNDRQLLIWNHKQCFCKGKRNRKKKFCIEPNIAKLYI